MFSYKFAPPSQPKSQARAAPLKGSDFDVTPSANLIDKKVFDFDGSTSQPFTSRRIDSHRFDAPAHLYNDPEIVDRKPLVPAAVSGLFSVSHPFLIRFITRERHLASAIRQWVSVCAYICRVYR